jgi:hypothetical protein
MNNEINKVIVFDLDHTIGDFFVIGLIWNFMKKTIGNLNQYDFNIICSLFPEIIRFNIIPILNYIHVRINITSSIKVLIYTNNKGGKNWIDMIIGYIESKMDSNIIYKIIENTNKKSYKDLIHKSHIPRSAKILFIDDYYHSYMKHEKVTYLNVKKYNFYVNNDILINTITNSEYINRKIPINMRNQFKSLFKNYVIKNNRNNNKKDSEKRVDHIVSRMILNYVRTFLNEENTKTRKNRKRLIING